MNDRELLELAARAIDLRVLGTAQAGFGEDAKIIGLFLDDGHSDGYSWNPLTDDGDALRLAVKLQMNVDIGPHFTEASMICDDTRTDADERHDDDPFAATRRAIVRAAAEIGKAMP